jgi:paraquat-inducible protein A
MTHAPGGLQDTELDGLIACPRCDLLHSVPEVGDNMRAYCRRCGTQLIATRDGAYARIVTLALTVLILMVAALFFPFLKLRVGGLESQSSVFDAMAAFSGGMMLPLSFAVGALIVFIPAARVAALIYTLWPLTRGRAPYRHATHAFRVAEALKPWSMAEIFILGVAVSLVKVAGLATVTLGPAFWAFAALVVVVVLQDSFMCKWSIWKSLGSKNTI